MIEKLCFTKVAWSFLLLDFIRIFDLRWGGVMEVGSSNWCFFLPPPPHCSKGFFFFFFTPQMDEVFFLSLTGGWIFFLKNYHFTTGFWGRIEFFCFTAFGSKGFFFFNSSGLVISFFFFFSLCSGWFFSIF